MRILHIIATLDPAAGGPTESVRLLLSYGPVGYTGEVVTLDDPNASFLKNFDFPVHALGPLKNRYGFSAKLVPWLRANRHRFDGVVINGIWQFCGLAALRAIRGHKPYVVFTHGMLDPYFRHAFPLKHLKKWLYWLPVEYWVLRGAFRVLFTCTAEKELAEKSFRLWKWTPHVVPYGTSGPQEDSTKMISSYLAKHPEMRNRRFLLYLGRIDRKKGCDLLVKAFAKQSAQNPDLHLVMAGPDLGDWRKSLEQSAQEAGCSERIHWPGMLQHEDKWGAFYSCEAFILPSHQENFGIAVAEAMACRKPVLLSDKVNIAAEIQEDGAGYMELDSLQGTEILLHRWHETPAEERKQMGERAAATFKRRYDMRENANTIIRLFEAATSEARASTQQKLVSSEPEPANITQSEVEARQVI